MNETAPWRLAARGVRDALAARQYALAWTIVRCALVVYWRTAQGAWVRFYYRSRITIARWMNP